jgi:anti-sigma-K factor RsiG
VSTEHRRRIDTLLDPAFVEGMEGLPLEELRTRRKMAEEVETELSFYRRLIHGRMDLVAFELRRRSGEETRSLVDALPEVLAVGLRAPDAPTRVIQVEAPDLPEIRNRALDRILDDGFPGILPELPDEELDGIWDRLIEAERDVSAQRRSVHNVTDALHGEIVRRYKDDPRQAITG